MDRMILVNGAPNERRAVLISQGRQGLPGAGVPGGTADGDVLQFFGGNWVAQPLNAMTVLYTGAGAAVAGSDASAALDYLVTQTGNNLTAIGNNATAIALLTAADGLVDNGDGTFSHTDNAGSVVTIDTNGATAAYVFGGTGTYTIGAANVDAAIQALDTGLTALGSPDSLVDNGDGTFTHTDNLSNVVTFNAVHTLVDNGDATYTFTNNFGGGVTTIDTRAASNTYVPGASVVTAGAATSEAAIQSLDAAVVTLQGLVTQADTLVDNGNGSFTHTAIDGTATTVNFFHGILGNPDGTYTFLDPLGNSAIIDTRAISNPYTHSGTGTVTPGATNVETAIQLLDAALSGIQPDTLVDNGDGTLTHTSNAGVPVTFNAGWTQLTQDPVTGVVTVAYPDGSTVNIQGLPSAPANSATPVAGVVTRADGTDPNYPAGTLMLG